VADRLRIVHVLDNLNIGGTELNAVRTAERLDRDRFDVRFLCVQEFGPLRSRLDAAGIPVHEIPIPSLMSASALRRGLEIRSMVRRERIHVVHAHDPYGNVLSAPFVRLAGRGAVISSQRWWRNVHSARVRFANRLAYRFAHCVLANSPAIGDLVVREEGVNRQRLAVIPNFVEEEAFTPLSGHRRAVLRERVGLPTEDIAVGVMANLYPVKNHAMLLRAAARLTANWPRVRFVIIGEGREREALEQQVKALRLEPQVLMPGRVTNEPGFAGIFDIAGLTSQEEGFPNWIVESMAAGRPVVATKVGGVPDALLDGVTGRLVAVDDDESLARAIEGLLRDEKLRIRLGAEGRSRARSLYHADTVMRALESLYVDLATRYGQ
jgi:glycosyltransferase involved in cell wall biosynthesis